MRIIISGGGTGGHIFPAIAIANYLKAIAPDTEILFVGANGKMEMEKVPAAGYAIEGLDITGFNRSMAWSNLIFPFRLIKSLLKASSIVKRFKPDIALGVGGFASGPLLYAAAMAKIPVVIQEQNGYAGVTNRLLARHAKKIFVAYNGMEVFFPEDKLVITGNPVRANITNLDATKAEAAAYFNLARDVPTILVVGGSLGAFSINNAILTNFTKLVEAGYQVIWQTGTTFYDTAFQLVSSQTFTSRVRVTAFIQRMDLAYCLATTVISRAGALAISELCIVGKPCILVPYPFAADNHQLKNAQQLVAVNAAKLVLDSEVNTELVNSAIALMSNTSDRVTLASNIASLAKPNATASIVAQILDVVAARQK